MSNLQILSTERLNKLIDETQLTLQELKQEVIRREHQRFRASHEQCGVQFE